MNVVYTIRVLKTSVAKKIPVTINNIQSMIKRT